MDIANLINEYGFPVVMIVGLGYFVYFIWTFINDRVQPEIDKQHMQLIKLIDRMRMLDQDLIRLQQKVNVVLKYKANDGLIKKAEEELERKRRNKDENN
jgi:hypothetical protein